MRQKITTIENSLLKLHYEYDFLTLGEIGNILIRFQAALRALGGLHPKEYNGQYSSEKPRFVISSVNTGKSIDFDTLLALTSIALTLPGSVQTWTTFSKLIYRRFKLGLIALIKGEADNESGIHSQGLTIKINKGETELKFSQSELDSLTSLQRESLANFVWSLIGPGKNLNISDIDSDIDIHFPYEGLY